MLYQLNGFGSLSKTNISNCITSSCPGFCYNFVESTVNVSFCHFENLKATDCPIVFFGYTPGRIERCNYINNSEDKSGWGLIAVSVNTLDIFDSCFQKNMQNKVGKLFDGHFGPINIYRCSIDSYSSYGTVYASDKGEASFVNIIKFIDLSPCELFGPIQKK